MGGGPLTSCPAWITVYFIDHRSTAINRLKFGRRIPKSAYPFWVELAIMLRYFTAGESHGKALVSLIDGFPAGVELCAEPINAELHRRQGGYGRGGRQKLETDEVDILTGVWRGRSIGSPIALMVPNHDYKIEQMEDLPRPRPGHGDLNGSIKYLGSIRGVLERASARETTMRVASGALAKQLLEPFGISVFGYVIQVGTIVVPPCSGTMAEQRALRDKSELYTVDPDRDAELKDLINKAAKQGDTLGGIIEVRVEGVPFGLGSHAQWDRKLDGRLAQALMSMQAIKGVEIGMGFEVARHFGSEVHDPIQYDPALIDTPSLGFKRPISTLSKPLESVNLETKQPEQASYERSDICAIAAASCVVENIVAFEIAAAMVDKFGGDSLTEMQARWKLFHDLAKDKLK
jgi:chorismate synthase